MEHIDPRNKLAVECNRPRHDDIADVDQVKIFWRYINGIQQYEVHPDMYRGYERFRQIVQEMLWDDGARIVELVNWLGCRLAVHEVIHGINRGKQEEF